MSHAHLRYRLVLALACAVVFGACETVGGGKKACAPVCEGKACGDDGCGGSCGPCAEGQSCDPVTFACVGTSCTPDCAGRICGDDGCGGSCGTCGEGQTCDPVTFACVATTCTADCEGRICGDDGCGGSCGACDEATGMSCNPLGACVGGCLADCAGRVCGDDGCGGSCGECAGADEACAAGACVTTVSCTNGKKDGDETDEDCGGACPKCATGRLCAGPTDCISGICTDGACVATPTCSDGAKGGDETDLDCGGKTCDPCAIGRTCKVHGDCVTFSCQWGLCAAPTCDDEIRNQGEADTDCGGPCDPCKDGAACSTAADCVSGHCEGLACISCVDGVRNGDETDKDCGGKTCAKCSDGKKCSKASDCVNGGCEGGTCCKANACGVCAAQPAEVCNGKDDDCDGLTDQWMDEQGALCPLQKGVCAGARQECTGGKWVCDAGTYADYSLHYQTTETKCDGRDNDCDGETDEGLLNACGGCGSVAVEVCNGKDDDCDGSVDEGVTNACGTCGPVPVEVCNGRDDDCNGQTDELAACASCKATPVPLEVSTTVGATGTKYYWIEPANAMIANGTSAWIAYRKISTPAVLHLSDGELKQAVAAPGGYLDGIGYGIPSVAPWGEYAVLTYVRAYNSFYSLYTVPIFPAGAQTVTKIGSSDWAASGFTASAAHGDRNLVAARGIANKVARWDLFESTTPGGLAAPLTTLANWGTYSNDSVQLRFRSDGVPVRFGAGWKDVYDVGAYGGTVLEGASGYVPAIDSAKAAVFQPKSDATFAAVWELDGKIHYQQGADKASWQASDVIVQAGVHPGFAIGPGDMAVVTWTDAGFDMAHGIWEGRRKADGTFASRQLAVFPAPEYVTETMVAVDTAGRAHIVALITNTKSGVFDYRLVYVMSCWGGE